MKKWVILLGLTIFMCFGADYALAQGHGHGAGPAIGAHHEKGHPPDSMGPLEASPLTLEQSAEVSGNPPEVQDGERPIDRNHRGQAH